MATKVFSGGKADLGRLSQYETAFDEGDEGYLDLNLSWVPPGTESMMSAMAAGLRMSGVSIPKDPELLGKTIRIHFRKMLPPLLLIVGAIGALILAVLVSFELFNVSAGTQMKLGLIIAGVLVVVVVVGIVTLVVMNKGQQLMSGVGTT